MKTLLYICIMNIYMYFCWSRFKTITSWNWIPCFHRIVGREKYVLYIYSVHTCLSSSGLHFKWFSAKDILYSTVLGWTAQRSREKKFKVVVRVKSFLSRSKTMIGQNICLYKQQNKLSCFYTKFVRNERFAWTLQNTNVRICLGCHHCGLRLFQMIKIMLKYNFRRMIIAYRKQQLAMVRILTRLQQIKIGNKKFTKIIANTCENHYISYNWKDGQ